jgi:two-component system, chemotaxis family, chemotaxis protein CheY
VLLVDDSEDLRMLLRLKLEAWGHYDVVGEAADGEAAVEMAAEHQPDLVMLDLAMPRMDGLQALPHIRKAVDGVRVIVLSGFDQAVMAAKATQAGADGYLEKGVPVEEVARTIEVVLALDPA